jgi:hypothetical protein
MNTIPWIELALAIVPVLIAVGCYELLFVLPMRKRVLAMDDDLRALQRDAGGNAGLAGRVVSTERRVREQLGQVSDRLGKLELRSDSRSYEQAINLAAKGGGTERLISYFGLSEGEASLVRLLHGRARQAPESKSR